MAQEMRLHHYIVVRRDLTQGVQCAMVAHAAGESFYQFARRLQQPAERVAPASAGGGAWPSRGATIGERPPTANVGGWQAERPAPLPQRPGSSVKEHASLDAWSQVQVLPRAPLPLPDLSDIRTTVVVLGARSEAKLWRLVKQLVEAEVPHVAFVESDGDHAGQLTAVGLEPGEQWRLSPRVKEFQLL